MEDVEVVVRCIPSDKLIKRRDKEKDEVISNRVLPHTFDWKNIRRSK